MACSCFRVEGTLNRKQGKVCIIATVCIVCADTYLNNKSVTHIAIRYIAAMLIVCDKIFVCICTEPIQTMCL